MENSKRPRISALKVMKSNAGYYIGRSYYDEEMGGDFPYSRDSGYFNSIEAAQEELHEMEGEL